MLVSQLSLSFRQLHEPAVTGGSHAFLTAPRKAGTLALFPQTFLDRIPCAQHFAHEFSLVLLLTFTNGVQICL